MERIFDTQIGDIAQSTSDLLENHVMLWAPAGTLDAYISLLEADRISTRRMAWLCPVTASATGTCYSLAFRIAHSMVSPMHTALNAPWLAR